MKCSWKKNKLFSLPVLSTGVISICLSLNAVASTTVSKPISNKNSTAQPISERNNYNQLIALTPTNPAVNKFINGMVSKHGFSRQWLDQVFSQVHYQPKIISLMERPAEKTLTWGQYRAIFMKPYNIKNGIAFWKANHDALSQAAKEYGVSPAAIVGILGVETRFGRITGGYKAVDALSTLGFAYPPREKFFKKELEKLLLLSRKEKMDPLKLTGSYAGALGMPQFMPSSYLAYAVDFTHSGQADIWHSPADAIGSIANYLKKHGWQQGEKIAVTAKPEGKDYKAALSKSPLPDITLTQAVTDGLKNTQWLPPKTKVRGLELEGLKGPQYWLTTKNFYAITRYNHSDLYAMAVYELGSAIQKGYQDSLITTVKKVPEKTKSYPATH